MESFARDLSTNAVASTQVESKFEENGTELHSEASNFNCLMEELNGRLADYMETVRKLEFSQPFLSKSESLYDCQNIIQEIEMARSKYKENSSNWQKMIDQNVQKIMELSEKKKNYKKRALELDKSVFTLNNRIAELETIVEEHNSKLEKKDSMLEKLTSELNYANKINQEITSINISKNEKIEKLKSKLEDLSMQYQHIFNEYDVLKKDFELNSTFQSSKEKEAQKKVFELEKLVEFKDYTIKEELESIRDSFVEEISIAKTSVASSFHEKLRQADYTIQELEESLGTVTTEKNDLDQKITKLQLDYDEKITTNSFLAKKLSILETNYEKQLLFLKENNTTLKNQLSEVTDQLKETAQKFEQLATKQVSLDMEIQTYNRLLESEEKRLGIHPKKRSYSEASKYFVFEVLRKTRLEISGIDTLNAQYIKVANNMKRNYNLRDHKLIICKEEKTVEFTIPEIIVPHNQVIKITCKAFEDSSEENFVQIPELETFMLAGTGPTIISISNPSNKVLCQIKVKKDEPEQKRSLVQSLNFHTTSLRKSMFSDLNTFPPFLLTNETKKADSKEACNEKKSNCRVS